MSRLKKIKNPEELEKIIKAYEVFILNNKIDNVDGKKVYRPMSQRGFNKFARDKFGIGNILCYIHNDDGRYDEYADDALYLKSVIEDYNMAIKSSGHANLKFKTPLFDTTDEKWLDYKYAELERKAIAKEEDEREKEKQELLDTSITFTK